MPAFSRTKRICSPLRTVTRAGSNAIFFPSSRMTTLMVRAGFLGSPGLPAEKCPWFSWATAEIGVPISVARNAVVDVSKAPTAIAMRLRVSIMGCLLQCPLWLVLGLTALGLAFGAAVGPPRGGDGADELATSYATVPSGCL